MIPSDEVYRTRRVLVRDYFLDIPESRIDLNSFGFNVLTAEGLGQGCGAVGCIAGWLQTMPEFRAWKKVYVQDGVPLTKDQMRNNFNAFLYNLEKFLGIHSRNSWMFSSRRYRNIPQKSEALGRLEELQTTPIVRYEEEEI